MGIGGTTGKILISILFVSLFILRLVATPGWWLAALSWKKMVFFFFFCAFFNVQFSGFKSVLVLSTV